MRAIVGREGIDRPAASTSQMRRFETEWLASEANLAALTDLSGAWTDRVHVRRPPDGIILDMDSSESPTHGQQEGSAWNGHFGCTCYHPLFVFNQFGDLERCALRSGNAHSAEGWREVLELVIARYRERRLPLGFRGDAAFAKPELYELLEAEGIGSLSAACQSCPAGADRPPADAARRPPAEHDAAGRAGQQVLQRPRDREQRIREGKYALRWTRLSCHSFRHNAVRLQLHALAYNLANFLRSLVLPQEVEHWSLTTLREKLVKIGARIVRHGRYVVFQLAEVAVSRALFTAILHRIDRLRPRPLLT